MGIKPFYVNIVKRSLLDFIITKNHTPMFKKIFFVFLLSSVFMVSCDRESIQNEEAFAETFVTDAAIETRSGQGGCYEIIFPLTVDLPDGTQLSFDSWTEGKEELRAWKELNPDVSGKPSLVFPVELINEEGEILVADSRMALREIRKECLKEMAQARRCFRLVFPIAIVFPDGSVQEFEDKATAKMVLREWKENNPDATERPMLQFPIEVEMKETGEILTVDSKEALKALKEDC